MDIGVTCALQLSIDPTDRVADAVRPFCGESSYGDRPRVCRVMRIASAPK